MALSSEALELQFGPTKLEILRQDGSDRISRTKAADTGQVLELSRVAFRAEGVRLFPEIHATILAGVSMGAAFQRTGARFERDVRVSCRYDGAPAGFARHFSVPGAPTVTDVLILVGPDNTPYADILEVYSPAVAPWEPGKGSLDPDIRGKVHDFDALLAHNP